MSEKKVKRTYLTPKRKQEIVLRLLRGEVPNQVARELGIGLSTLYEWRDRFLKGGVEGLKYGGRSKLLVETELELKRARQTIGRLAMEWELQEKKRQMQEARKRLSKVSGGNVVALAGVSSRSD